MHPPHPLRTLLISTTLLIAFGGSPSVADSRAASGDRFAPAAATAPGTAAAATETPEVRRVCPLPAQDGEAVCQALLRTDLPTVAVEHPQVSPRGFGPADIRSAYAVPSGAAGATVAVVIAFHHPRLEHDLAVYRAQFGLPACTAASGCLRVINQRGGTSYPASNADWAVEEALDVEAVSAVCRQCRLLVVEADSASGLNLLAALDQAVAQGARFVSASWGGPESSLRRTFDRHLRSHPGIAFAFASGDTGYGLTYPASSPYVTAVGGTSLRRTANARGWTERAWPKAGSGCSAYEPKPSFQKDTLCSRRTVADVSAVADPATGLAFYTSVGAGPGGWGVVGGTSLAAPLIAAMYALAGTPGAQDYPNSYPYAHRSAFNDIIGGANGYCGGTYLCTAVAGYDGPTGLGTPRGVLGFTRP